MVTYNTQLLQGNAAILEWLYESFLGLYNVVLENQCAKFALEKGWGNGYMTSTCIYSRICTLKALFFHMSIVVARLSSIRW